MNVYCDNAAMKPLLPQVKEVIQNFISCDYGNPSSIHSNGRKTLHEIEDKARPTVANFLNANPNEIIFTSGSTESINWVCQNYDYIITTDIEHKAILNQPQSHIIKIPILCTGIINMVLLEAILDKYHDTYNKKCIAIFGYVNNEIGTIQPVKELATLFHKYNIDVCCDATQAIGNLPINVHELNVDYLCGSGQKIGALSGCGFLYVREGTVLNPMELGGQQEHGMRAGTENILGILALAKAFEVTNLDLKNNINKMYKNRDKIIFSLLKIPNSYLNGSLNKRVCNNINISFKGIEAENLVLLLDTKGIKCSTGSACNSTSFEPSHVLKAIGLSDDLARGAIRITINETISDSEIDYVIQTVTQCVKKLRGNNNA